VVSLLSGRSGGASIFGRLEQPAPGGRMRAAYRWLTAGSLFVPLVIACGASSGGGLTGGGLGGSSSSGGGGSSGGSSSGLGGGGGSSSSGVFQVPAADARPPIVMMADSACKAGFYQGAFTGTYASNLAFGIPLSVSGNVELTLDQEGTSNQTCTIMVQGEGLTTESCSDVFTLSGGTITGTANKLGQLGDAAIGGFPYFCTMTGTLDCKNTVLDNGWIECRYCVGNLTNDNTGCSLAGGTFAGPLTANYDTTTLAFTGGTWNGAEALCEADAGCNDGGSPGPDGGSALDYIAKDGGYTFGGPYGGSGDWMASCLTCNDD
jgi:hypothetical protein